MDYRKLSKPDNLSEEAWREHLRWMRVGAQQLDENFTRHLARVKEDANRCEALLEQHRSAIDSSNGKKGLFSR